MLGEALSTFSIAAIYSSPLQRAYHTALPIAARHGLDVQTNEDLSEGKFGLWEGLSRTEVLARSPLDEQQLRAWEADPTLAPPGGESFAAVQTRVCSLVEHLVALHPGQEPCACFPCRTDQSTVVCCIGCPIDHYLQYFSRSGNHQRHRLAATTPSCKTDE